MAGLVVEQGGINVVRFLVLDDSWTRVELSRRVAGYLVGFPLILKVFKTLI